MELYTVALYNWRSAEVKGIPVINTTIKTGDKRLAPNWNFLTLYQKGTIDEDEYTRRFYAKMRWSYHKHRQFWDELICKDTLALACYCKPGKFCHRHLLVDIITKIGAREGIEVLYKGELEDIIKR